MKTSDNKLLELRKFVTKWLWESNERKTEGCPWDQDYVDDAASMVEKALAEGERRGRIAGLREAAAICSRLGLSPDARVALNDEANRLEKEQSKSISSDTPETKTKQER